jgi:hypothetical protein
MKRTIPSLFAAMFLLCAVLTASAGTAPFQPVKLIDLPTAGALPRGSYSLDLKFFSEGSISSALGVGITNRLSIGIAYELMRVIGQSALKAQSFPGGMIKYRMMEESYYLPGLAMGFDSEGAGRFYQKRDGAYFPRFYFKSKGAFAALSKSYLLLGQPMGLHYEVNYSFVDNEAESEGADTSGVSNRSVDMGVGIDKSINDEISIMAEYDLALDDNHSHNPLKGYLHAGLRWSIVKNLALELDFKDILENKVLQGERQSMSREVRIVYRDNF